MANNNYYVGKHIIWDFSTSYKLIIHNQGLISGDDICHARYQPLPVLTVLVY